MTETPENKHKREALEQRCRQIATTLKPQLPDGTGFCLFLFDFGEGGNTAYMANGQRDDVRALIVEWLVRAEPLPPAPPVPAPAVSSVPSVLSGTPKSRDASEPYDSGTQKLLDDLHAKPQSFDRDEIIRRAKKLRYHSYKSDDAMNSTTLIKHLAAAGYADLAKNAMDDKYEQDAEESRRWAEETDEGRAMTAEIDSDPALRTQMTAALEAMGKVKFDPDELLKTFTKHGTAEEQAKRKKS
jgi:hypothetical protein